MAIQNIDFYKQGKGISSLISRNNHTFLKKSQVLFVKLGLAEPCKILFISILHTNICILIYELYV